MKLRMMTRTEPDLGLDDLALKPVDEFDHTVHGTGKSQLSAFVRTRNQKSSPNDQEQRHR